MRFFLAVVCSLLFSAVASATWVAGTDGYYYWNGSGSAYSRYWNAGYYFRYGCNYTYYPGYYSYTLVYTPAYAPAAAKEFDEVAFLAGLAKQKAKQQNLLEGLAKLGYTYPNLPVGIPAGYLPTPAYTQTFSGSSYLATGSTLVGYPAYNVQAAPYFADPVVALQQSNALAQYLASTTKDVIGGHQSLVDRNADRALEYAKAVLIRDLSLATTKLILAGPPSTLFKSFKYTIEPTGPKVDSSAVPDKDKEAIFQKFSTVVEAKCGACHNDTVKKGGINLKNYLSFSDLDRNRVLASITRATADQSKWMPRLADGGLAPELTAEEKWMFMVVKGNP